MMSLSWQHEQVYLSTRNQVKPVVPLVDLTKVPCGVLVTEEPPPLLVKLFAPTICIMHLYDSWTGLSHFSDAQIEN